MEQKTSSTFHQMTWCVHRKWNNNFKCFHRKWNNNFRCFHRKWNNNFKLKKKTAIQLAKFIVLIFSIPICGLLGMLDGPGITIFYILYKVSWLLWKPSFLRSKKTLLSCTINIKHCTYVMLQQCLLKKNNTWVAVDYYATLGYRYCQYLFYSMFNI